MNKTKTPTIEEIVKAVETLPKNTQEAVLHEMLEVVQDFAAPVRSPEDQAIIEQRAREPFEPASRDEVMNMLRQYNPTV